MNETERPKLRRIVLCCLLSSWTMGCGGSATGPSPAPPSESSTITFKVDIGVSRDDEQYIRDGIANGQAYFAANFNWTPTSPVTVQISNENGGAIGRTGENVVYVFTKSPGWIAAAPALKRKISVHELFHVVQFQLGALVSRPPVWLVEGSAEYVAYREEIIDRGIESGESVHGCQIFHAAHSGVLFPKLSLGEGSAFYGYDPGYSVSYLATEYLTRGPGLSTLAGYFRETAIDGGFESAFGMAKNDFYTNFELYRAGWVAPDSDTCLH